MTCDLLMQQSFQKEKLGKENPEYKISFEKKEMRIVAPGMNLTLYSYFLYMQFIVCDSSAHFIHLHVQMTGNVNSLLVDIKKKSYGVNQWRIQTFW